ncbi:MAG: endonuclease/exonuclease/phosphatase, partial [Bauldia sp.]
MQEFKLTTWNIEHADKLIDALDSSNATTKRHAEARRDAIRDEITMLAGDILVVCEGPNGESRAGPFFQDVAPGYRLIVRGSADRRDYGMQGTDATTGRQWIWFLVR